MEAEAGGTPVIERPAGRVASLLDQLPYLLGLVADTLVSEFVDHLLCQLKR